MSNRDVEEYRNLREAIRDRGTARVWVFVVGLAAWGGLAAVWSADRPAWAMLVPLVVIAGVFEAVFALHTGAERIGRYIQVFHERADDQGWEHRVMALGRAGAMTFGGDALFSPIVIAAIVVNFAAGAVASPGPADLVLLGGAHLAAFGRVLDARRRAKGQREADLKVFENMKV
jgi:hypothetical protein